MDTIKEFKELANKIKWKFAVSYVHISPHWYVNPFSSENKEIAKRLYMLLYKLIYYENKAIRKPFVVPPKLFQKPKIYYYAHVDIEEFTYWISYDTVNRTYINEEKKIEETIKELRRLGYSEEEITNLISKYRSYREFAKKVLSEKDKYEQYFVDFNPSVYFFFD